MTRRLLFSTRTFYRWLLILALNAWTLSAGAQVFTSSNLPVLIINTNGQTIPDEPKIIAELRLIDNGPGHRNALTDKPALISKIGIERRGATSQQLFPKKPYGIELRDSTGLNSVAASLLGMPAESDWVLNATYNDKTLIRETLTYDLNRQMSAYYTPRYRYCEVILNGAYDGLYIFLEKIKRDKNRVNISSIKKTDVTGDALTGGYIFKIDKTEGSPSRSWTSPYLSNQGKPIPIQIDRPKLEDLAEEQFQYAKTFINSFENALRSDNYQDSAAGFRRYANEDSFVDYLLITELCKNQDGYRLSVFFSKDRDSKGGRLTIGPIWDYNLTYGNANYCNGESPRGWAYDYHLACPTDAYQMPFWWGRLLSDRAFSNNVQTKYHSLRKSVLKTERIHQYIDSVATALTEARARNFERWPVIGKYVWPNSFVGQTYQQEIDFLKEWVRQRLEWLDTAILQPGAVLLATESAETLDLTVSPNPSMGDVTIRYWLAQRTDLALTITDATGRVLRRFTWPNQAVGTHQTVLPASGLPTEPGVYYVKLTGNQRSVSRKLVRH